MVNAVTVFFLLALTCIVINAQWITEKHVEGIIDRDDDYWVVKSMFFFISFNSVHVLVSCFVSQWKSE